MSGSKFPGIRSHLQRAIGDVYAGLDLTMTTFPADDVVDPKAYLAALDSDRCRPGDVVTIFTPDDVSAPCKRSIPSHSRVMAVSFTTVLIVTFFLVLS